MTESYDIIPDIHGQYNKLVSLLSALGWQKNNGDWQHSDKERKIIFLGDFIDRGLQNKKVISLISELEKKNLAYVIMGNHELNAIYFHSINPETGHPLRKHSLRNIEQHQTFLDEFPLHEPKTKEIINWFCSLPLFLDFTSFRVVHACWTDTAVATLSQISKSGTFSRDFYTHINRQKSDIYLAIELLTKGSETNLPKNYYFTDSTGVKRYTSRLAWWRHNASSWRDLSVSIPNETIIPNLAFQEWNKIDLYPINAAPVFFGHYWMEYPPLLESDNALCLDCSAGTTGPLISYHFDPLQPTLDLKNVTRDTLSG